MQCRVTVSRNHPAAGCSVTQRPCRGQQSRGLNAWDLSLSSCCSHGVASVSSQMVITVPPGSDAGRSSWVHTGATLSTIGMGHLEHLITVCCGIITVCCCCLVTKLCLCLTVCDPWIVDHQAPLSKGFPRQEYWSGLSFPSPGDLPHPGIKPAFPVSPALAGRFFTSEPRGSSSFPDAHVQGTIAPAMLVSFLGQTMLLFPPPVGEGGTAEGVRKGDSPLPCSGH